MGVIFKEELKKKSFKNKQLSVEELIYYWYSVTQISKL